LVAHAIGSDFHQKSGFVKDVTTKEGTANPNCAKAATHREETSKGVERMCPMGLAKV